MEVEERIYIKNPFKSSKVSSTLTCFTSKPNVHAIEIQISKGSGKFSKVITKVEKMYSLIQEIVCIFWIMTPVFFSRL